MWMPELKIYNYNPVTQFGSPLFESRNAFQFAIVQFSSPDQPVKTSRTVIPLQYEK